MVNPFELDGSECTPEFIKNFLVQNPYCSDRVLDGDAPDLRQPLQNEDASVHQFQYASTLITPFVPHAIPQYDTPQDAASLTPLSSGVDDGFIMTAPSTSDPTSANTSTPGSESTPNTSNESLRSSIPTGASKAKKTPAPKKPRAKCTQCDKSFQVPKTILSQICFKCRKTAKEVGNGAVEIQEVTGTITLPDGLADATSSKTWNSLLEDPEAATNQLLQKPVLPIGTSTDDYGSLDKDTIMGLSKQIFDALLAPPVQPPNDWDDEKKDKYRTSQLNALARCNNMLLTNEDQSEASARCRLAVDDAIKLHQNGLLINELTREARASFIKQGPTNGEGNPRRFKTGASLLLDMGITCSERIERIIEAVRKNKIVAEDLLNGFKALELVRCPTAFLERKITNFTANNGKHADEKAGGDLRRKKEKLEKEAAAAALVDLSQTGHGGKRKALGMEGFGGALHVESATRMRTAGDAVAQPSSHPYNGYGQLRLGEYPDTTAPGAPEM